jgi:hypothetical protein
MIWDSLAPILLMWSLIGVVLTHRHWIQVKRVYALLLTIPNQIRAAWQSPPQKRTMPFHDANINIQPVVQPPLEPFNEDTTSNDKAAVLSPKPFILENLETVPGAGTALLNTPTMSETVRYLQSIEPDGRYLLPYGWFVRMNKVSHQQEADIAFADLSIHTTTIAIISPHQHGKTSFVIAGMMGLTLQHAPDQLQFAIFNLKDTDWYDPIPRTYLSILTSTTKDLAGAIKQMYAEAKRRSILLARQHVLTWNNYRGSTIPLMVIYLPDLVTLRTAVGTQLADRLLTLLLVHGPGLGFRVIIESTERAHLSSICQECITDWLFGPSEETLSETSKQALRKAELMKQHGVVAPARLPVVQPGVFTAIDADGNALTFRTVHRSTETCSTGSESLVVPTPREKSLNDAEEQWNTTRSHADAIR